MDALRKLFATPRRRVLALLVFANLFVYALISLSLHGTFHQHRERAETTSRNINRLVAQSVAADIDRVELALRSVEDEVARLQPANVEDWTRLIPLLTSLRSRLPMVDAIRCADAQGLVVAGSGGVPSGVSVASRSYFRQLRDDPKVGLAISEPVVAQIGHKWVLVFARRLVRPDGAFGGAVYAVVTIDWFIEKFRNLEVGANGAVVLRGDSARDFDMLARFPPAGFVGQTKVSDAFRANVAVNPRGGTYRARGAVDDILRTFSYQPVAEYPLITMVGLATEDYLLDWWRDVAKLMALGLLFTVASGLGGWALMRSWRTLEQRTEELAQSNADLEQFAYVASHDLQTPLRNIASYTQLLARRHGGKLDRESDEFMGYIVDGAKRMAQMISDLRDYTRLSAEVNQAQPVALGPAVTAVLGRLAEDLEAVHAQVDVGDLPEVNAERGLMETLFHHLIDNAVRYRAPTRTLSVTVTAQPEGTGRWRVTVQDNGTGIEPEYQDKIFALFQRLEPMRYPGGTGIGLAVCRRIVHRFNGRIWVDAVPGGGSAFHVVLPAAPSRKDAKGAPGLPG